METEENQPSTSDENEGRDYYLEYVNSRTDEELQTYIDAQLLEVILVMGKIDEAKQEMKALHTRIGKRSVRDMDATQRAECDALYRSHWPIFKAAQIVLVRITCVMKHCRSRAIDNAKCFEGLNALEVLKLRHGCLPVVDLDDDGLAGYGVGAIPWPENKRLEKKEEVVAFVEATKTWIVAECVGSISNHRYECIDIDDQEKKVFTVARKQVIPLPKFTVNYRKYPHVALPRNARVLALFPGTTCFYEGKVFAPPETASGHYQIRFYDSSRTTKYSEPQAVSDRYVIAWKKDPVMYVRPEKRTQAESKATGEVKEESAKQVDEKQKKKKKARKPKEEEDLKDVPGPAPKALVSYYESPDEDELSLKKGRKKRTADIKRKTIKMKKPKVRRARVPEHKKKRSTRMFGKRRPKKKTLTTEKVAVVGADGETSKNDEEEADEVEENVDGSLGQGQGSAVQSPRATDQQDVGEEDSDAIEHEDEEDSDQSEEDEEQEEKDNEEDTVEADEKSGDEQEDEEEEEDEKTKKDTSDESDDDDKDVPSTSALRPSSVWKHLEEDTTSPSAESSSSSSSSESNSDDEPDRGDSKRKSVADFGFEEEADD
ncbi:unnamed protein product [Caenorhabditis sp. 36 PRJEB53466]|nr:unnamed protein product [Caenorhabditis sp. 36 PRJEB53466]